MWVVIFRVLGLQMSDPTRRSQMRMWWKDFKGRVMASSKVTFECLPSASGAINTIVCTRRGVMMSSCYNFPNVTLLIGVNWFLVTTLIWKIVSFWTKLPPDYKHLKHCLRPSVYTCKREIVSSYPVLDGASRFVLTPFLKTISGPHPTPFR